jgi:outer membrane protein insertion porin family
MEVRRHRGRFFRRREWEDDLDELQLFLEQRGFHRSAVHGEVIEREDQPEVVDLVVQIDEGARARIEAIDIDGAVQVPPDEVLGASGLEVGSLFNATGLIEARDRILDYYRNRGFQQASVEVRPTLDETGSRASVGFAIEEGGATLVDQVILAGLVTTRRQALDREVMITPDGPLSAEGLVETRQRLVGMGLFRDVDVEVLPKAPASQSSDVLIRLEEGPRTSFGYGFGYNERELARAEVELTRRNLFGLNRTASIFARASIRGHRLITTYRQPEFLGLHFPLFVTAFSEEEDRKSFDYTRLGVGLSVSKSLSSSSTLFVRYNYQRTRVFEVQIEPDDIPRAFRNERLSTVSIAVVTDTRDDPISPSRGQFRILDVGLSTRLLGSNAPFVKGLAQQFFYYPLPGRMVAAIGLRLGVAQSFREEFDALIPITERFFAGGANTLRGFGLDQASPKNYGAPVGGNVLSLLNLELRFPIAGELGGVVFSDNGNVYRRLKKMEALNWRYNMGFGVRYETPLGPLRVDYGFKLDRREGEPLGRLHVSLGHAF